MMLCTFGKGKERISLGRRSESGVLVVVRKRDQVREYRFSDSSSLRTFQSDMEAFLRKTGWTLLEYSPERRRRERDRSGDGCDQGGRQQCNSELLHGISSSG